MLLETLLPSPLLLLLLVLSFSPPHTRTRLKVEHTEPLVCWYTDTFFFIPSL